MWQNVNNEVLLSWFKLQAKILTRSGVCVQGDWQKYTPPSPPLSKDEALKNIGHSMSTRNLIFGVNSVTISYLIRYDSLLQSVTEVYYKMRQVFYYKIQRFYHKMRVITKCNVYYKLRQYNVYVRCFAVIVVQENIWIFWDIYLFLHWPLLFMWVFFIPVCH